MEALMTFFANHGLALTIIATLGIILLGVLKYANVFSNVEKEKRKPVYFAISIGFSLVASIIYLLIIGDFSIEYVVTLTAATYGLNQTMYAVYETTTLRELLSKLFKLISEKLNKDK